MSSSSTESMAARLAALRERAQKTETPKSSSVETAPTEEATEASEQKETSPQFEAMEARSQELMGKAGARSEGLVTEIHALSTEIDDGLAGVEEIEAMGIEEGDKEGISNELAAIKEEIANKKREKDQKESELRMAKVLSGSETEFDPDNGGHTKEILALVKLIDKRGGIEMSGMESLSDEEVADMLGELLSKKEAEINKGFATFDKFRADLKQMGYAGFPIIKEVARTDRRAGDNLQKKYLSAAKDLLPVCVQLSPLLSSDRLQSSKYGFLGKEPTQKLKELFDDPRIITLASGLESYLDRVSDVEAPWDIDTSFDIPDINYDWAK